MCAVGLVFLDAEALCRNWVAKCKCLVGNRLSELGTLESHHSAWSWVIHSLFLMLLSTMISVFVICEYAMHDMAASVTCRRVNLIAKPGPLMFTKVGCAMQ